MKAALYLTLVVGLVPVQTTLLPPMSVMDVRPDLCLIAACLIGFLAGEMEGLLMGLALGFAQDLFSAGGWGLNLASKGMVGLCAGLLWRQMANPTTAAIGLSILGLSVFSGAVFLLALQMGSGLADPWPVAGTVVLPQALFDAALGTGLYWLIKVRPHEGLPGGRDSRRFGA